MRKNRIESMDALRAFACLGVLCHHMYLCVFGHLGVALFFVMSGFLSVYNYLDTMDTEHITMKSCVKFSYNKITKLYPLYFAMLLIPLAGQVYGAANGLTTWGKVFGKFAANALLLQSWVPINEYYFSLNGAAWYLSSIGFSYLMLPLILRGIKKLRSNSAALAAAFAIWAMQLFVGWAGEFIYVKLASPDSNMRRDFVCWFTYISPMFRVADFSIGGIIAYIFLNSRKKEYSKMQWTLAEVGAVALITVVHVCFKQGKLPFNDTSAYVFACAVLVYTFAVNRGYISSFFTNKVVKYISNISSEIFLTHAVVIFVCSPLIERLPLEFTVKRIIYLVSILVLTFVAANIGKQFNNAINRRRNLVKA